MGIDVKSDRSLRQEAGVKKWIKNKGVGILQYATGVGKTRCALLIMDKLYAKKPNLKTIIVVPTKNLAKQWSDQLDPNYALNVEIFVVNTAIKKNLDCDLLIVDEIHKMAAVTFIKIFQVTKYKLILGLTATLERNDQRDNLITNVIPIIDIITVEEAMAKGWLAKNKIYKVVIEVDDYDEYLEYDTLFTKYFSYFDFNFPLAMACIGKNSPTRSRLARIKALSVVPVQDTPSNIKKYNDLLKYYNKEIMINCRLFNLSMGKRKSFIANHPKKFELANKIIEARKDQKIITFNSTIKNCDKFKNGLVIHSKKSQKLNEKTLKEFNSLKTGVIHTANSLDTGTDIKGLSTAIILYNNSSGINRIQRYGRVLRKEGNKEAEIFSLILKGTQDEKWFTKSSKGMTFQTINEDQLMQILRNEPIHVDRVLHKQNFVNINEY